MWSFIRDLSNRCKSINGIDASKLYPYSICQDMPTGLYTKWEFDSDMQKIKARHHQSRNFEIMVKSYYQETKAECRTESFTHLKILNKLTVSINMDIVITPKQCLKLWDAITIFILARRFVSHLAMKTLREETKSERGMT